MDHPYLFDKSYYYSYSDFNHSLSYDQWSEYYSNQYCPFSYNYFPIETYQTLPQYQFDFGTPVTPSINCSVPTTPQSQCSSAQQTPKTKEKRKCSNCESTNTCQWRNVRKNALCNACFVYEKKYKKSRPMATVRAYQKKQEQQTTNRSSPY